MRLILFALVFLLSCRTMNTESEAKIIGGEAFAGMPEVGAIVRNGKMHCTATLIAPNKILTAAHCIEKRYDADVMDFVIGPDVATAEHVRIVARNPHPAYESQMFSNDIGTAELEKSLDIPLAPIFRGSLDNFIGRPVLLVGYGQTSGRGTGNSGKKRSVEMKIAALNVGKIRFEEKGKSSCSGDSGGPAFIKNAEGKYEIIGVTACGSTTCDSYGVYTRIDPYQNFLALEEKQDPAISAETCGKFDGRWKCDGQVLKSCSKDCFGPKMETKSCTTGDDGFCWDGPSTSRCLDPSYRKRTFVFETLSYKDGAFHKRPMAGRTLSFDKNAFYIQTNSSGEGIEYIQKGEHTLSLRKDDMMYTPASKSRFLIEDSDLPIKLQFGDNDIQINAKYSALDGQNLYVTGPGPLFDEGQTAYKMTLIDSLWSYKDALPAGMPFQLLLAESTEDRISSSLGRHQINTENQKIPVTSGPRNTLKTIELNPKFE